MFFLLRGLTADRRARHAMATATSSFAFGLLAHFLNLRLHGSRMIIMTTKMLDIVGVAESGTVSGKCKSSFEPCWKRRHIKTTDWLRGHRSEFFRLGSDAASTGAMFMELTRCAWSPSPCGSKDGQISGSNGNDNGTVPQELGQKPTKHQKPMPLNDRF